MRDSHAGARLSRSVPDPRNQADYHSEAIGAAPSQNTVLREGTSRGFRGNKVTRVLQVVGADRAYRWGITVSGRPELRD